MKSSFAFRINPLLVWTHSVVGLWLPCIILIASVFVSPLAFFCSLPDNGTGLHLFYVRLRGLGRASEC